MRDSGKKAAALVLAVLMLLSVFPVRLLAAPACTVTFRAGNVGSFQVENVTASVKDPGMVSVQPEYIKITGKRGEKIQNLLAAAFGRTIRDASDVEALFLSFLSPNETYCMRELSAWGPAVSDVVRRNTEYVIDYGMLVDPVPYRISYVDKDSGEEIAAPVLSYGNEGQQITAVPVQVERYETTETAKFFCLSEDEENEVIFYYRYMGPEKVDGKTVYRTEYRDVTRMISGEPQREENRPVSDSGTASGGQRQNRQTTPDETNRTISQESEQTETETTIPEQEVPLQAQEDTQTDENGFTKEEQKQEQTVRDGLLVLLLVLFLIGLFFWKKKRISRR